MVSTVPSKNATDQEASMRMSTRGSMVVASRSTNRSPRSRSRARCHNIDVSARVGELCGSLMPSGPSTSSIVSSPSSMSPERRY